MWTHTSIPPFNRSPLLHVVRMRGAAQEVTCRRSVTPSLLQPHVSYYFSGCRTHLCWLYLYLHPYVNVELIGSEGASSQKAG
jgi:hypothetical protein